MRSRSTSVLLITVQLPLLEVVQRLLLEEVSPLRGTPLWHTTLFFLVFLIISVSWLVYTLNIRTPAILSFRCFRSRGSCPLRLRPRPSARKTRSRCRSMFHLFQIHPRRLSTLTHGSMSMRLIHGQRLTRVPKRLISGGSRYFRMGIALSTTMREGLASAGWRMGTCIGLKGFREATARFSC